MIGKRNTLNKDIEDILKKLEEFGWYALRKNWEAGYIVLGGFVGKWYEEEDIEDANFGLIFLTRNYKLGDWDYNIWDIEFISDTGFCANEIGYLHGLITALNNCKDTYPKANEDQASVYEDRLARLEVEKIVRTEGRKS